MISQNLLIDSDENVNDNQLFSCNNKPIKRKSNLKKSKFISPSRKFVINSPTKLNKNRSLSSLFKQSSSSKSNLSRSNLNKSHLAKSQSKSDQCKHPKSAKLKRTTKAIGDQLGADKDENLKESNYKDKFKKQRLHLEDELGDKLLTKLKDVEKGLLNEAAFNLKSNKPKKQCKEKASLSSDQAVTNVFNKSPAPDSQISKASTGDFLNQHFNCFRQLDAKLISEQPEFPKFYDNPLDELDLKKSSGFIDDQLLDEQLNDKLDLDNLISSLIDKLDSSSELNDLNRDAHFDSPADNQNSNQASNQLSNDPPPLSSSVNRQPAFNSAIMVSNKNLALNSVNDKHLLNSYSKSSKTNGLSNGHSDGHSNGKLKLESHFNSSSSSSSSTFSSSKSKKSKKDVNSKTSKAKPKVSSLYDFHFDSDDDDRQSETDLFSLVTDHSSSSTDHSSSSISSSSSNAHKSTNGSKKQQGTNKSSKLFTIQSCIKSEIRKKLLEKSLKLSKKSGTKSLTNGDSLNGSKKVKSTTKLNGKADGKTESKTDGKVAKIRKKDKLDSSDEKRVTKKKKKDDKDEKDGIKKEKDGIKKEKDGKEKDSKDGKIKKQPRTPHLTKNKVKMNGQTNGQVKKRKYVRKKALQRRSELLRRNLYKFRQYLRIKKEELLNLDRDELSALSQMTRDLMHCFIDTQNFEIDFDIYDPLMVNGLLSTQPFSGTSPSQSILSSELLKGILNRLQSRAESKSNGYDFDDDSSTEEEPSDDECWTSAPSSPI